MTPRELRIAYLLLKVNEEDWQGVCNAANDLREIDAKEKEARRIFRMYSLYNGTTKPGKERKNA